MGTRCAGCGAHLRLRPEACPLCGSDLPVREAAPRAADEAPDPDDYRAEVRSLREQLRELRSGSQVA